MKLSNGKEVVIDLYRVTRKDWKNFVNPRGSLDSEDVFISKVTGLTVEEVGELTEPDFRAIVKEVIKERQKPIDPNSQSAST